MLKILAAIVLLLAIAVTLGLVINLVKAIANKVELNYASHIWIVSGLWSLFYLLN